MRGSGSSFPMQAERGGSTRSGTRAAAADQPKRKPNFKKVLPEIWKLVRPRRWLLMFGLLLVLVRSAASLVLPYTTKALLDRVFLPHRPQLLLPLVLIVFAATAVQAVTSYSLTQLLSKAAQRMITELREQVQTHIGRLPVSFYDSNRTGVLVSRIMTDVEGIRNLIGTGLIEFVGGIATALIAFSFLVKASPRMTLVLFCALLGFIFVLQKSFRTIRPIFRERGKINAEVTGRLTESLGGVRVIKGYHAEEREARVFSAGVHRLLNNVVSSLNATSLLALSATAVLGTVGGLVMFFGGHEVLANQLAGRTGAHGLNSPGSYFQYVGFLAFMIAPIFQVVNVGTQLTEAIAGLDRTMEVLGEREEFGDPARGQQLPPIEGRVEFRDVQFAYEADKPVLHGISFNAQPGTVTALVGSSGSGKSTIISLICAFHTPTSGQILIDGRDLSTIDLASYRSQLGVVLQESFLFDGTIRDNIVFSLPGATDEDFLAACRIARVDEFAERFSEGYDTVVGERGVKLSGGQRQRLSIARALLANPRLLILDEATSSLDSESEAMIQQGLNTLMQGRTTFVIAHRLSTIRKADQILVVEGGEVIERGTHGSLFALRGRYHELYTRQHGIEENLFLAPGEGDAVPATR